MNIKEIQQFIAACDIVDKVPLVQGLHGIGKSDAIRQYAKENNLHCETLILSLMDVGDLMGLPRTVEIGGTLTTYWAAPDWYNRVVNAAYPPEMEFEDLQFKDESLYKYVTTHADTSVPMNRATLNSLYCKHMGLINDGLRIIEQDLVTYTKGRRSIVFLDEFNRAPVDILNASLQLVLDKRLHSHLLPRVNGKQTFVVAAINPSGADYTVNDFDPALLDRFTHCTAEADAGAWLDWARTQNVNPIVRDFIAEHPDRIHWTPADGGIGATPRSWTALGAFMDTIDKIPEVVHFPLMKGSIGMELASQFLSYYNNYAKVVKMEDIEKLVATKSKRTENPAKLGEHVAKLMHNQEAMQKTELAENMFAKYVTANTKTAKEALPFMSYLYGLDIEILAAFLKQKKDDNFDNYMKISKFDDELNNKELFKKIVSKIK